MSLICCQTPSPGGGGSYTGGRGGSLGGPGTPVVVQIPPSLGMYPVISLKLGPLILSSLGIMAAPMK